MRQQHHKNITLNLFILRNLTIPEYTAITPTYRYSHVHCASQQLTWSKIGSEVRAKHQPYLCGTTPDRPSFVHDPTSQHFPSRLTTGILGLQNASAPSRWKGLGSRTTPSDNMTDMPLRCLGDESFSTRPELATRCIGTRHPLLAPSWLKKVLMPRGRRCSTLLPWDCDFQNDFTLQNDQDHMFK